MTGNETKDGPGAKRQAPDQNAEAPSRAAQPRQDEAPPVHRVANQGAPGGTSDDDGDSENQQDPSRRAPEHRSGS